VNVFFSSFEQSPDDDEDSQGLRAGDKALLPIVLVNRNEGVGYATGQFVIFTPKMGSPIFVRRPGTAVQDDYVTSPSVIMPVVRMAMQSGADDVMLSDVCQDGW
jgi:hypothetical protein